MEKNYDHILLTVNQQLIDISMKISELFPALSQIGDRLEQAKAEIIALLDQLRQADPDLSPEGASALARLQQVAEDLDSVAESNPQPTPEPPPQPEVERTSGRKHRKADDE